MRKRLARHAGRRHATALVISLALAACAPEIEPSRPTAAAAPQALYPPPIEPRPARHADFRGVVAGSEARHIADWAVDSGDHRGAPFLVVDKAAAHAYLFDREGILAGHAPVLLGLARGDDTPPGIGDKPLSAIRPDERITGAGRYVGELGYNLRGEDVLWVDYDEGLSLHRVLTTNRKERRAHRLATPTTADNRVSYGCINVPVKFFEQVVRPAYRSTRGMIYVLPETRPARVVFHSYDVDERARLDATAHRAVQAAAATLVR